MAVSPEAFLISAVLRTQDLTTAMSHGVVPDMFHNFTAEWQWIEDYYKRYRRVPSKVAFRNQFNGFTIRNTDDTGHFSDEVRKAHARQLMLAMMQDAADAISDGDIERAVKVSNSSIIQIAAAMGTNMDADIFTDYSDILFDVESRARRVKEEGSAGIPTGMHSIDDKTGGLNPGELVIVGGRLGHGKSWVLQSWAAKAALEGYTVQFDSLEMTRSQVGMRIHSLMSGNLGMQVFSNTLLLQGKKFSVSEYKQYLRELKKKVAGKLHLSDTARGRVSTMTVAAQIERNRPDVVYIDYLTLMQKTGSDWQGVAELSGELQALCAGYQLPIVAAAQLNREHGLGKEPAGPEALAQSDAIGQDAARVVTMLKKSRSVLMFRMAKDRNAAGDFKWYCEFDPDRGILKEVSANRAEELMDIDRDREDQERSK